MSSPTLTQTISSAFQTLLTQIINAATYVVQGIVDFLSQNYDLVGLALGLGLVMYLVIRYGRGLINTIVGWFRGLFA